MCGLVGVAGVILPRDEKLFRSLLVVDSLRGEDSTGIAAITGHGDVEVVKALGDPFQLFETRGYRSAMGRLNRCIIGHNRYATTGRVNRANAHPFEFSKVVGAHNGTLRNKGMLLNGTRFEVDSEALYNHINEKGIDDAIKTAEGAWALSWYDKEAHTINFLRNAERPLNIILTKDRKTMFWASESWMLTNLLLREQVEFDALIKVPENVLYSWKLPDVGEVFDKPRLRTIEKKTISKATRPTTLHTPTSFSKTEPEKKVSSLPSVSYLKKDVELTILGIEEDEQGVEYLLLEHEHDSKADFRLYKHPKVEDIWSLIGSRIQGSVAKCGSHNGKLYWKISPWGITVVERVIHDHEGKLVTEKEFKERYNVCSWCSSPIEYGEDVRILSHKDCLCQDCMDSEDVKKYLPFML